MRIHATALDTFRLYMHPDNDWLTEQDVIDAVRFKCAPTPEMQLGIAFERVLQDPERYRVPHGFVCNGYTFSEATMAEPLELVDHQHGTFQVKTVTRYGVHEVVSKADHLQGARIREWKTTTSSFAFDKYAESFQWRYMLDGFEAALLTYDVFVLDDHGNGVAELKAIESFNVFPYPDLRADCERLLSEFVGFAEVRGLARELNERQATAAAGVLV